MAKPDFESQEKEVDRAEWHTRRIQATLAGAIALIGVAANQAEAGQAQSYEAPQQAVKIVANEAKDLKQKYNLNIITNFEANPTSVQILIQDSGKIIKAIGDQIDTITENYGGPWEYTTDFWQLGFEGKIPTDLAPDQIAKLRQLIDICIDMEKLAKEVQLISPPGTPPIYTNGALENQFIAAVEMIDARKAMETSVENGDQINEETKKYINKPVNETLDQVVPTNKSINQAKEHLERIGDTEAKRIEQITNDIKTTQKRLDLILKALKDTPKYK